LHQKIKEPRSYDYNRKLSWVDRARMPQFKLGNRSRARMSLTPISSPAKTWTRTAKIPRPGETKESVLEAAEALRLAEKAEKAESDPKKKSGADEEGRGNEGVQGSGRESLRGFQAHAEKDEADAREAVMTFVLGLVAEPIRSTT